MSQGLPSIILVPVCLSGMTLWRNRSSCAAAKREKPGVQTRGSNCLAYSRRGELFVMKHQIGISMIGWALPHLNDQACASNAPRDPNMGRTYRRPSESIVLGNLSYDGVAYRFPRQRCQKTD